MFFKKFFNFSFSLFFKKIVYFNFLNNFLFNFNFNYFSFFFFRNFFIKIFNYFQYFFLNVFFFVVLDLIGLGYKVFKYKNSLFFKLGYSHFLKLDLPEMVFTFSRRRSSLILYSLNRHRLFNFLRLIYKLRSFNFYKGKGFSLVKKSSIVLKVGKQQQH